MGHFTKIYSCEALDRNQRIHGNLSVIADVFPEKGIEVRIISI